MTFTLPLLRRRAPGLALSVLPAFVAALIAGAAPIGARAQTVAPETTTETTAETTTEAATETMPETMPETTAEAATEAAAPPASADSVVAIVNGEEITLGELIIMRTDLPEEYRQLPPAQIMEALLSRVAVETTLAKRAIAEGLDATLHAKLRARVDARSRLAEARIRQVIEAASNEEALRAAYAGVLANHVPVPEVRASHILVAEKAKAEDLLAQIANGASFADLAAEHGTDGTKTSGGDLGWFEMGQMVPEFAQAAFAAEDGAYVGPVQTQFGWHLIHVTGKRERPAPSYEDSVTQIGEELANKAAEAEITAARDGADVQRPDIQPADGAIADETLLNAK
jgi:peptidyl-prolyl cis-trans isomerase C